MPAGALLFSMESAISKWLVAALALLAVAATGLWASSAISGQREAPGGFTRLQSDQPTVSITWISPSRR